MGLGVLSWLRLQYASTSDRYKLMGTDSIDEVVNSFESHGNLHVINGASRVQR